jgi:hypothetical protein
MLRRSSALAALLLTALPAFAQTAGSPPPRTSPHETINANISGSRVMIVYGRPYSKDPRNPATIRPIWGSLVPYDKVWRLGSDEATLLVTQSSLVFGETTLAPGAYSLYLLPSATGAKLIINKSVGQWGIPYPADLEKQEIVRLDMKKEDLPAQVDQLTIALSANPSAGPTAGLIKVQWEKTQFSIPFTVKK